jgi:hypothetical protein
MKKATYKLQLYHRIAHLSAMMSVAGGDLPGAPQQDLSTGEGGKDDLKFTTKCRKIGPAQPISLILRYFFAYLSIL